MVSGVLTLCGAMWIAVLAFGRLLDSAGAGASSVNEQVALAFFYIAAAACVGILRGIVAILTGPGVPRALGMGTGILVIIVGLIILAKALGSIESAPQFWIALSLPVLGSFVDDACSWLDKRRVQDASMANS